MYAEGTWCASWTRISHILLASSRLSSNPWTVRTASLPPGTSRARTSSRGLSGVTLSVSSRRSSRARCSGQNAEIRFRGSSSFADRSSSLCESKGTGTSPSSRSASKPVLWSTRFHTSFGTARMVRASSTPETSWNSWGSFDACGGTPEGMRRPDLGQTDRGGRTSLLPSRYLRRGAPLRDDRLLELQVRCNRVEDTSRHWFRLHREDGLGSRDDHFAKVVEIQRVVLPVRLEVPEGVERPSIGEHEIEASESAVFLNRHIAYRGGGRCNGLVIATV